MTERLKKELEIVRTVFPAAEYSPRDTGWYFIPRYTVQYGGWAQTEVAVCFQVPSGYPGDAPYAFWVTPVLRQSADNKPPANSYQEPSATPFPGIWGKFSWSDISSWKPGADPASGSNFLNFVLSFRDRFREGL
jgi:Prokaryotic E2 family E